MNIFEQYGIKEVADVCLYSIELDENDDEVYVPILYFDTLKVSSVEQTAEQTSARGGLGNPHLIFWDYGKEITVTLEDALYTPASQSLMWGGKYGTKKIELTGTYQPKKYLKEDNGEEIIIISEKFINEDENGALNDGLPVKAKIICENVSGFEYKTVERQDTNETYGYYAWTTDMKMISRNGIYRTTLKPMKDASNNKIPNLVYVPHFASSNIFNAWGLQDALSSADIVAPDTLEQWIVRNGPKQEIRFYKTIKDTNGDSKNVVIGVFTLDKKQYAVPPQECIYQIESGITSVPYLERIEKCVAPQTFVINCDNNLIHGNYRYLHEYDHNELTVFIDPKTMEPYEPNAEEWIRKNGTKVTGSLRIIKQHEIYYKWTRRKALDGTSLGGRIIVDPIHFPGTYRLVGETYSRSRATGKDQRFQFEIPLCKMGAENSFTLEAAGDPTTFTMTLKVLRREDGVMMKLTQYDVAKEKYDGYESNSFVPVPNPEIEPDDPIDETYIRRIVDLKSKLLNQEINIINPQNDSEYILEDELEVKGPQRIYTLNDIATEYTTTSEDSTIYAYQKLLNGIITSDFLYVNGELLTEVGGTTTNTNSRILEPNEYDVNLEKID